MLRSGMTFGDVVGEGEARERDRRMLKALLEVGAASRSEDGLSDKEEEAFEDMLDRLDRYPTGELSAKQREWVERRCEELGVSVGSPAERNARVPRGREVEEAPALRSKPKVPPGRKAKQLELPSKREPREDDHERTYEGWGYGPPPGED